MGDAANADIDRPGEHPIGHLLINALHAGVMPAWG